MNNQSTLENLSLVYELSLSIGRSLDLTKDCEGFLKTFMSRKNLSYGSIWIKNRYLPDKLDENWATLVYAHPVDRVGEKRIPVLHPIFSELSDKAVLLVSSSEDNFTQFVDEKGITKGELIMFALGEIGVLKLFSPTKWIEEEINQIETLMPKFTTSLEGCLSYQKAIKELTLRQWAETELKRHQNHLEEMVKERTEELVESEEKFRLIFETAKDAIFLADPQTGLVTNCNKAAEVLLEKKREEIIGFHQTKVHPPEKAEAYVNMFRKHIEHNGWAEDEAEVITRSGKIKPVQITASVTIIGEKPIIQGIFRDITERKQLEANLIKTEKLAATAQIASEAAHEVKNPLAVIKAGLYYLNRILTENEEAQKTISQMDAATERATTYIDDLLNFSKPSVLTMKMVDVNKCIEDSFDELPQEILAEIEIEKDFAVDLPLIEADPDRLGQVFVNLIKNGVEAMGEVKSKKLKVKSEREEGRSEEKGDFVKISVVDTGNGVPEEDRLRVFDPFFTTKGKGTGLGLAICQQIIDAHKGEIEIKSEKGKGTVFVVRLLCYGGKE